MFILFPTFSHLILITILLNILSCSDSSLAQSIFLRACTGQISYPASCFITALPATAQEKKWVRTSREQREWSQDTVPRTSYLVTMNIDSFLPLPVILGEFLLSAACPGVLDKALYPKFGNDQVLSLFFLIY